MTFVLRANDATQGKKTWFTHGKPGFANHASAEEWREWGKMDAYDDVERAIHGRAGVIIDGKEWKLVPVEATQAMLDAAEKIDWSGEDVLGNCCNQWYAMLAAAPPAPVVEVTKATCNAALRRCALKVAAMIGDGME